MFYPDETLLDNGESVEVAWQVPRTWLEAPKHGLQGVLQCRNDGLLTPYEGQDFYAVLRNGQPFATSDVAPAFCQEGLVKYGVMLIDEQFEDVRKRMQDYRRQHEARRG